MSTSDPYFREYGTWSEYFIPVCLMFINVYKSRIETVGLSTSGIAFKFVWYSFSFSFFRVCEEPL